MPTFEYAKKRNERYSENSWVYFPHNRIDGLWD